MLNLLTEVAAFVSSITPGAKAMFRFSLFASLLLSSEFSIIALLLTASETTRVISLVVILFAVLPSSMFSVSSLLFSLCDKDKCVTA